jgi:hypothetical protein
MGNEKAETYEPDSKRSEAQREHRAELVRLFQDRPMADDELLLNLGLFTRSSMVAKLLFLDEAYRLIKGIPGVIMEFGLWWGNNLVAFENLRAVHEPFNQTRRIIGFDTFTGYANISSENDIRSETIKEGAYSVSEGYKPYLDALMRFHEAENVLGNLKRNETVAGDVVATVPQYFLDHPETIVALACFDLACYEPTKTCLSAIRPHLVPGSVIMFDELNNTKYPGETVAFKEFIGGIKYDIHRSTYFPDRTFVVLRDAP